MPTKASALITLGFVTVLSCLLYSRVGRQEAGGRGDLDLASQLLLGFLGFGATWLIGLMGAIRSLLRQHFHVYSLVPDSTSTSFAPTLAEAAWWITGVTLLFHVAIGVISLAALRPSGA
ncbi:MAG: hypothetical protein ACREI3_06985 [Nitrospirales bacterium]